MTLKKGQTFTKGFIYPPLFAKVCPWKRLIAFVSVNKNPRLYGRGCIVNIDMDYLRSLAFIRITINTSFVAYCCKAC